jgi:hypothetical protein
MCSGLGFQAQPMRTAKELLLARLETATPHSTLPLLSPPILMFTPPPILMSTPHP